MIKILAFLKKDFLIEKSYKFSLFLNFFSILFSLLIFFFINKMFYQDFNPYLKQYNIEYFNYVFLSLLIFNFTGAGLGSISEKIRNEKVFGTFEYLINNEKIISSYLFSIFIFNLILSSIEALIYLFFAKIFFNFSFSNINFFSLIIVFSLSLISFYSLGIISSCFIILFKKGNPLAFLLNSFEGLLGGVYFPIGVLPLYLQKISKLLPIYYSINAMQKSFYLNASVIELKKEIIILFLFAAFLLPISIYIFKKVIYLSRIKGSLNQY